MNSMTTYRFDGSFEGFICAVSHCLEQGLADPEFVRNEPVPQHDLFMDQFLDIPTVRENAVAFRKSFVAAVSPEAFAMARYAFHSRRPAIEQLVWRYLKLGCQAGRRLEEMLADEPVYSVNRIGRQVCHEAHKFKGFVRFQELREGFLYACVEPQADVVPLIAPHFVERVADRRWMIHDPVRRQAALYDLCSWRLIQDLELTAPLDLTMDEREVAALWQRYFQCHAITERHNPRLQQKHIPLRYRKQLTEFGGA